MKTINTFSTAVHLRVVVKGLGLLVLVVLVPFSSSFPHAFQFQCGHVNVNVNVNVNAALTSTRSSTLIHSRTHSHPLPTLNPMFMSSTSIVPSQSKDTDTDTSKDKDKDTRRNTGTRTRTSKEYPPRPQLVEFIEPKTKVKVILIGTMHYNPTSVRMVQDTVQKLAKQNSLGSVVVESCDIRWNSTMELLSTPSGKFFAPVLTSEMKAASDEALKYGRPCVLGDQRINATGESLGNTFRQTFVDVASPFGGGWGRLYRDFKEAADVALPTGGEDMGYLSAKSFLDPRLLIAAPVSFAKYPLSFLVRNPLSAILVFSILGAVTFLDGARGGGEGAFADATIQEQILNVVASLSFAGLEFAVFARIMVQVLLAERNEILAQNILRQCRIYSKDVSNDNDNGSDYSTFLDFFSFFSGNKQQKKSENPLFMEGSETVYVPGSIQESAMVQDDGEEKVVVAVLGMAHCNGIVKLLKEQLVE